MAEVVITKDNFEQEVLKSEIPVILDFWAVWCGPCKMVAPELSSLAEELEGMVTVGKVNVDEEMFLAQKFNIEVIPTLVLIKDGEEVKRTNGYMKKSEIISTFNL